MNIDDIEFMHPDAGGGSVFYYQRQPFTGSAVEYKNGILVGEITVVDSHTNGKVTLYYDNGQILEEYFESYNCLYGIYKRWDKNGNLIYQQDYGLPYQP